jgi:hypothetical protein
MRHEQDPGVVKVASDRQCREFICVSVCPEQPMMNSSGLEPNSHH